MPHIAFCAIVKHMKDVIRHLPARLLTPDERALVAEWIASAGDIAEAYVSSRRGDDPALYHRIVIVTKPEDGADAPCPRANWSGHLDCPFIGPANKGSAVSYPPGCIEFRSTGPCGDRIGRCVPHTQDDVAADMLGMALSKADQAEVWKPAIAVTWLMVLTGWRRGEVLVLRWLEAICHDELRKPAHRSVQNRPVR